MSTYEGGAVVLTGAIAQKWKQDIAATKSPEELKLLRDRFAATYSAFTSNVHYRDVIRDFDQRERRFGG